MKQKTTLTALPIYQGLSGQNYSLQKISEREKQLITGRDTRKGLNKTYKRSLNITDGVYTLLILQGLLWVVLDYFLPVILPLEIVLIFFETEISIKSTKTLWDYDTWWYYIQLNKGFGWWSDFRRWV